MAWNWNSAEEFKEYVLPVALADGTVRASLRNSTFESHKNLFESLNDVSRSMDRLSAMGFTGEGGTHESRDDMDLGELRGIIIELVYAGENLLLHHKRLAQTEAAYGFLSQHDILDHLDRYDA